MSQNGTWKSKANGFSIISGVLGTLAVSSVLVLGPGVAHVKEYLGVRWAAAEVAENLTEARRVSIGNNVDRRIRLTSEHGYVREKRAGAGWQFEEAYVMPEGLEIEGPDTIEFWSHSALGPAGIFTISGPDGVHREVITRKNGAIGVQ